MPANTRQQRKHFLESEKKLHEKYSLRPCRVILNRIRLKEIRIEYSVETSGSEIDVSCISRQENANTFSIEIKRKASDDFNEITHVLDSPIRAKKPKLCLAESESNEVETSFGIDQCFLVNQFG